jgi:hypothetical protein
MKPTAPTDEYRGRVRGGRLKPFSLRVEQSDLFMRAQTDLTSPALELVIEGRRRIEDWAATRPEFLTSLKPLAYASPAPSPVREMLEAGRRAGVGPMAAVAGALADYVGQGLMPMSPQGVVVENGGDIFLFSPKPMVVGLFAGRSKLSMQLGLSLAPDRTPWGVCTSSGTLGHSLSLGRADAATVVADTAALADAAATALGNRIHQAADLENALEWVMAIPGIRGALAFIEDNFGFLGDLELVSL